MASFQLSPQPLRLAVSAAQACVHDQDESCEERHGVSTSAGKRAASLSPTYSQRKMAFSCQQALRRGANEQEHTSAARSVARVHPAANVNHAQLDERTAGKLAFLWLCGVEIEGVVKRDGLQKIFDKPLVPVSH